jgi:hypothetical protein
VSGPRAVDIRRACYLTGAAQRQLPSTSKLRAHALVAAQQKSIAGFRSRAVTA